MISLRRDTLQAIRAEIGWTREVLARVLRVNAWSVELMERGAVPIDEPTARAVLNLTTLTYDELDDLLGLPPG